LAAAEDGYGFGQAVVIDSNYQFVASTVSGLDASPADLHEFQLIDDPVSPTALLTTYRAIPYDLSAYNITTGQGWVLVAEFQEVNVQTGEVIFDWQSIDHVPLNDTQIVSLGPCSLIAYFSCFC
jgi:hypothetical protein